MKCIPKYFTLFDVIINVVYLISFLDCSLQMYRNTTHFCILILYSATLQNLVFNEFRRISKNMIM